MPKTLEAVVSNTDMCQAPIGIIMQ